MAIQRDRDPHRCVLVIEDNRLLVNLYRSIFESLQCSVLHAATRREAVRLLDVSAPDLFIIDDRLADAPGTEALRAIRAHPMHSATPALATVLQVARAQDAGLLAAGFAAIVTKPLQISSFTALARRCLGNTVQPQAARAHTLP